MDRRLRLLVYPPVSPLRPRRAIGSVNMSTNCIAILVYTGNSYTPGDVKVEIQDGQYEIWAKNGLVGALTDITALFQSVEHLSYREPSGCDGDKGCVRNPAVGVTQWWGPDSINLQVRDSEGGLKDFIHILITPEK